MIDQGSREILYYKVPVFISDLTLHFGVLWMLVKSLDEAYFDGMTVGVELYVWLAIAYAIAVSTVGIRLNERGIKQSVVVWRATKQTLLTCLIYMILLALAYKATPRFLLACLFLCTTPLVSIWHLVVRKLVEWFRRHGHNTRMALFVGGGKIAASLYSELCMGQSLTGYRVLGYINDLPSNDVPEGMKYLGKLEDLEQVLDKNVVEEIYCTLPPAMCEEKIKKVIKICNDRFIEFYFVPTMKGYPKRTMRIDRVGAVNVVRLREEPLNSLKGKIFKRSFDILLSGLFICTLFPLVCLLVFIGNIMFGNRGPLFFKQVRTGYNGRAFTLLKFRSMRPNEQADTVQTTKDDSRKTMFGDFLRRSSIDELPQFLNVLKGDMSIIGPRPHMLFHTDFYSQIISDYMVRHLAKPGITGYAQVNGCRGETQEIDDMRRRVEYDVMYIENWTPLLDVEIFFMTFGHLFPGRDKQAY